jgi:hypothetical protein
MALEIKSLYDLKKYLEARKDMAHGQGASIRSRHPATPLDKQDKSAALTHVAGMVYAYGEAINAVSALIAYTTRDEEPE